MVSPRYTGFLLILLFLPLRFSCGNTQHQQVKKRKVVATESKLETARSLVNLKEIYDGVPAAAETDQRTRFLLPGRKMMSRGVVLLSKKSKVVVESEHGITTVEGSTTNEKAVCEIGNCNHVFEEGKGTLNNVKVKDKFSTENFKMSGFVPFNADYHVPRPHPPKNN